MMLDGRRRRIGNLPQLLAPHEPAGRLLRARLAAGFATASDFARHVGANITTYHHHEAGKRTIDAGTAWLYANALHISPSELMFGGLPTNKTIPIVGIIGNPARATPMESLEKPQEPLGFVQWCGDDLVAHLVPDDSNAPVVFAGDTIWTNHLDRDFDPNALHARQCVVELEDGVRTLAVIAAQSNGLITLMPFNGSRPTMDMRIVAAARVRYIERASD